MSIAFSVDEAIDSEVAEPQASRSQSGDGVSNQTPTSMVERVTLILDVFAEPGCRLGLEEIARRTRLPRSTAHRILEQLIQLDWVEHNQVGYVLGSRSLGLGRTPDENAALREAAAGRLQELHLRTGLVVHLAVLEGTQTYCLDKVGSVAAREVPTRVGGRAPVAATALGRALLVWESPEEVDELATGLSADQLTALHRELTRARGRGGLVAGRLNARRTLHEVAVAIRDGDGPIAAVSLVGASEEQVRRFAPLVAETVQQIRIPMFGETVADKKIRRFSVVR